MTRVRYKMATIWTFLVLLLMVLSPSSQLKLTKGDVEFENPSQEYYRIHFAENKADLVLFHIEDATGELKLSVSSCSDILYGSNLNSSMMFLNQSLDYEQTGCQDSNNYIQDKSSGKIVTFEVVLINEDDNAPQFKLGSSTCLFEENSDYPMEDSTCKIQMTDQDGMLDKAVLSLKEGNSSAFGVDFYPDPKSDDKSATIVIYLKDGVQLDYETRYSYVLVILAEEEVNPGEVQVAIDVKDLPDQPPKFTKMISTEKFEENIDQVFNVSAVDGDIGIDSPISYKITENGCDHFHCTITISPTSGEINVKNVDREETGDTISLTIAAVEEDDKSETPLEIKFFIIDQDDEIPAITVDKTIVEIDEGSRGTITKFRVEDMDLSDAGTFHIKIENGGSSVDHAAAFEVIPDSGYQNASFTLTVVNSTALDYEDENWKVIKLEIRAIENKNESHTDSKEITINLIDINDEPPIFVNTKDSVDIREDIVAGKMVFNASAVDKDAGDIVSYEIVGIWNQKLDISKEGIITTKDDNVFDYELLEQVLIAIKASDNDSVHVTSKTLTINVQDVDDEPPVLRYDITTKDKMAKIDENSEEGVTVDGLSILVTDPDTNPDLVLEIDWEETYVTKNSRIVDLDSSQTECFAVEWKSKNKQTLIGSIKISDKCSPDFEKFDAIVLYLKATDKNTEKGDDSMKGSVLINIVDLNDNYPRFIDSSLKDLVVIDGTDTETKIGVISAQDDDMGTELTFSIEPDFLAPDWVTIDPKTGELTVKTDVVIDCDKPKRDDIKYKVTVHDPDPAHDNTTLISIRIEDVNDETPVIIPEISTVYLIEKSPSGKQVTTLNHVDFDRDDPFNRVVFKFDTNITDEASNTFSIDPADGLIHVSLRNGATLDRDSGPTSFVLPVLAYDNPKGTLQLKDHFDLKVILKDVDDHIPILTTTVLNSIENAVKDDILNEIQAFDPDEDGPNSNVSFELTKVIAVEEQNTKKLNESFFEIKKKGSKTADLKLLKPLKGYWGKYNLTIRTKDEGNEIAYTDNIISLTVEKFNFLRPVFDFPKTAKEKNITVDKDVTNPKSDIILPNGDKLKYLTVDDQQDHKWDVTFEITAQDDGSEDLFRVIPASTHAWEGALQLARVVTDDESEKGYSVTIRATVKSDMKKGEAPGFEETTLTVNFFSYNKQPTFDNKEGVIDIDENSDFSAALPAKAHFSSPVEGISPHYFIVPPSEIFKLDSNDGIISSPPLDYEEKQSYELKIVAMNRNNYPVLEPEDDAGNVFKLTINVNDMNDHEPIFNPTKFTAAFLRNYINGTTILTINATDGDPTLQKLTFTLKTFSCSEMLNAPKEPFSIGSLDGKITNNFVVTSDMSGSCNFYVVVEDESRRDEPTHKVETTVQINIISDDELVKFTFMNPDWYVHQFQDDVTSMIDENFEQYGYKCYLADMTYDPDWHNSTAHFFFINDHSEPVPAKEILGNLTDPKIYSSLTKSLETIGVHLNYFSEETINQALDDYLKTWLIVTIIILGSLLALLTVVFFFRYRALTRRISNLSTTKFGSQESGLNRAGVTAPTTNKNAIEGSNPVFNSDNYIKEVEDDRSSVLSGDSDLLGVENNPNFDF